MTKNKKIILLVSLLLIFTMIFAACDLQEILDGIGNGNGNGNGEPVDYIFNVDQKVGSSYDKVDESNFASVVASNNLNAIFEVTTIIEYSYTVGGQNTTKSTSSSSTAFAINDEGYLLTNAHCVTVDISEIPNASNLAYVGRTVLVNLADEELMFKCDIIAYDVTMDLCVLKILDQGSTYKYEADGVTIVSDGTYDTLPEFHFVTFFAHTNPADKTITDPVKLFYGESVVAIGNANGFGISVTTGVVSAPYRVFDGDGHYQYDMEVIQLSAAINTGNSGGPLFNAYGAVIGINTFKIVELEVENMAYAIPTYVITDWIESLADGSYNATHTVTDDETQTTNREVVFTGVLTIEYTTTTNRAFSGSN